MDAELDIKQQVREFYDQVGWQEVSDGLYQNARYEDLRPVSSEYIHRCHMRVANYLRSKGRYLLDAGSGPIQYPAYLEYSKSYAYRVCADISIQALIEARKRIGEHGLFVVADIAHMPFAFDIFEGVVSLHTIHHLPMSEHLRAYKEIFRVLIPGSTGVVVNGWHQPTLGVVLKGLRRLVLRIQGIIRHRLLRRERPRKDINLVASMQGEDEVKSTYVEKNRPAWFKREIATKLPVEIRVWRSVSVKDLRTFIHPGWGGRGILRALFWFEERFPRWFGGNGQYPLILIHKKTLKDQP
jgi:ubiquinone/menaquinone biosynthesis C-methylase UbiE